MMISIQGQLIYWRDYKNLNLLWQDVTQLFNRHSGQWLAFAIMMVAYLLGGGLAVGLVTLGNICLLYTSCGSYHGCLWLENSNG